MRNAFVFGAVQRIAVMCSMLPIMTRPITATGPGSIALAQNVKRRRGELDMSGTELRERLSALGLEVHRSWISEVENRKRIVNIDELLYLAAALTVSPSTLLMPQAYTPDDVVDTVTGPRDARDVWEWLVADRSIGSSWIDADDAKNTSRYRAIARPAWAAFDPPPVPHRRAAEEPPGPAPVTAEDLIAMDEADRKASEGVHR